MSASISEPLALSPADAAKFLSVSRRAVSKLIAEGKLAARKLGNRTLVDVAVLRAYYENLPMKTSKASLPCSPQLQR
jgi:excisionase family DNA binding protein